MRRARLRDYAILTAVCAVLTLPNLGATSLWDVDEGVNAEAAREMRATGSWVIPTFNFELRTAKPVMLYWLQRGSYAVFGVSEWSARLPSVLAVWLAALLVYELARSMFGRATGLLAGVALASACEVCALAHAATPDATLLLFTVLTYYLFWTRHADGSRRWWVPTAAACGLAMLTKGPVGVALPGLVILLYFAWNRELRRLFDYKLFVAAGTFLLVAGPWYLAVAAETRGAWPRAFFGRENVERFSTPMENHRGPILYHAGAILVLFAPWSVFLLGALWSAWRGARQPHPPTPSPLAGEGQEVRAYRFLLCWFAAYLVFFSAAATKLPNYMLPAYPVLAILTARFLAGWRAGELALPKWMMPAGVGGLVLVAVVSAVGLVAASGAAGRFSDSMREFPGLERYAVFGAVPLVAAIVMARALRAGDRARFVQAMAVGSVAFTALMAAFPPLAVDARKAPKELVRATGVSAPDREVRLAQYHWHQPSLVFYARREVEALKVPADAATFLAVPTPGYLFVPAPQWEKLEPEVRVPTRVAARRYCFLRNCEIVVITNDAPAVARQ
jgi:4-amino-4-deoxy-L-arabinose transferase-like glycosyltransferase